MRISPSTAQQNRSQRCTRHRADDATAVGTTPSRKTIDMQKMRTLLTKRKLLKPKLTALDSHIRASLRGYGFLVGAGACGSVREPIERNDPILTVTIEGLWMRAAHPRGLRSAASCGAASGAARFCLPASDDGSRRRALCPPCRSRSALMIPGVCQITNGRRAF